MANKKKLLIASLVLLLLVGITPIVYFAVLYIPMASVASADSTDTVEIKPLGREVDNIAFGIGEKLSFDINYGFINAGTATMEVSRLIEFAGRPAYQIVTTANSNDFFSTFYKVEDRAESIMDAIGLFSWHFEKRLREGNYKADRLFDFDQMNGKAFYKSDTFDVPMYTHDVLSALYYVRTQKLEVGKSLYIDAFNDGKLFPLEVRVVKKEKVSVDAGQFECVVVEPLLQSVGVFKHSGSLKVWLTDDRVRLPVLMKSKVLVGSISAELTDYELGELDMY
jgi:hypothetical protein